jgi:hypothetical protein
MRRRTRRGTANKTHDQVIAEMQVRIAENLRITLDRIRYHNAATPGQFKETGWRWEIFYRDEWRELPWHFDGPLAVDRELVRHWYGTPQG